MEDLKNDILFHTRILESAPCIVTFSNQGSEVPTMSLARLIRPKLETTISLKRCGSVMRGYDSGQGKNYIWSALAGALPSK